jgi:DNA primase
MALIPQSFIADLLNRVDIVDVVGQHVKLKKRAQTIKACAPFIQKSHHHFQCHLLSSSITALDVALMDLPLVS